MMTNTRPANSLVLALILLFAVAAYSQDSPKTSGIDALKAGDLKVAVQMLERAVADNKQDAEAWNYLGITYLKLQRYKDSARALDKAVDIEPRRAEYRAQLAYAYLIAGNRKAKGSADKALDLDRSNALAHLVLGVLGYRWLDHKKAFEHADTAIANDPKLAGAYRLRSMAALALSMLYRDRKDDTARAAEYLASATSDLEKYLALDINDTERSEVTAELEGVRYLAEYYSATDNGEKPGPDGNDNSTPLRIDKKRAPHYTDSARQRMVSGAVKVLVAFLASGMVGPVVVIQSLDPGLDAQSIVAAKHIEFTPATRNGKPITVVKQVEYTFEIR